MVFRGTLFMMPAASTYRVVEHAPSAFAETSGGGSGSSTVTVPGNADEIVARASGSMFTVTKVDDNTVTLVMPAFINASTDIDTLAAQLLFVFGPPDASPLGYLTVTARGILGLADSSDAGGAPDYIPIAGYVTLTPTLSRPIRLIATGEFMAVGPVTCTFDSDGELAFDGVKDIKVIAPQWSNLSNTAWKWQADIKPGPGQSWPAFTVLLTGAPGAVINLATLVS